MRSRSNRDYPAFLAPLLVLLCLAGSAWLWASLLTGLRSTLFENGNWWSEKREMAMYVNGAGDFLATRPPLRGGHLNLGAWHGFQSVRTRAPFYPSRVVFRFQLPGSGSYLVFHRRVPGDRYPALRLSRKEGLPTGLGMLTAQGEYDWSETRDFPAVSWDSSWHQARIEFTPGLMSVFLDGKPFAAITVPGGKGEVGFRAGAKPALIDDIEISEGNRVFTESFESSQGFWEFFLGILGGLLLLAALPFWRDRARSREKGAWFAATVGSLVVFAGSASVFAFDRVFWSTLHWDHLPLETNEATERSGYPSINFARSPVLCERDAACAVPANRSFLEKERKTEHRLLFLGTSQTLGVGARRLEDTFFARVHRLIAASQGIRGRLSSLNISVAGSTAEPLFEKYRDEFIRFRPQLTVINLGHNGTAAELAQFVPEMIRLNQELGIATALVKEAVSPELRSLLVVQKLRLLEELSARYQVPLLDLNGYFNDPAVDQSGFLWWDYVHFTSLGHKKAADWLYPRILELLKRAS